uniref:C-type lectin domain-containing protein n=2 Tax=Anser TaxID=8842 RepID=A0A8B9CFA6_9AVES
MWGGSCGCSRAPLRPIPRQGCIRAPPFLMPYQWGHPWGELSGAAGMMYGNIEPSQPREGQKWVLGPGGKEACSDPCPMEENPYEPLDPPIAVPSRKHLPDPPARPCCSQERLVLVGAAALGVSVLLNVLLLAIGSRRIAALTVALDEAEMAKQPPNVGCPPCSRGWTYFEDSCYFHSATTSTWESAQRFCLALGTRLLEVDSPKERTYIQTILRDSSWLGITDKEVEGTWKRADGTILPREQSSWHRNEPNGGQQENCAVVRKDGTWFDYPCTSQLPWVCEGQP